MTVTRYALRQLAKQIEVHVSTCQRWVSHGVRGRKLKSVLVGGRRYVLQEDLDAFLAPLDADGAAFVPRDVQDDK